MGEYAYHQGRRIKIGTCENLYYMRADQALLVTHSDVDMRNPEIVGQVRFRFPWPDEDNVRPGDFEHYDRGLTVHAEPPEGLEHYKVQFRKDGFGQVLVPCPLSDEGRAVTEFTYQRNGFAGPIRLVQQRLWEGRLVAVCDCTVCGSRYRLPEFSDAEPLVAAIRTSADRYRADKDVSRSDFMHQVADRITAGYTQPNPWTLHAVNQ